MKPLEISNHIDMWNKNELTVTEAHVDWAVVDVSVLDSEQDQFASMYITNEQVVELRDWLNAYIKEHIT